VTLFTMRDVLASKCLKWAAYWITQLIYTPRRSILRRGEKGANGQWSPGEKRGNTGMARASPLRGVVGKQFQLTQSTLARAVGRRKVHTARFNWNCRPRWALIGVLAVDVGAATRTLP